MSSMTRLIWWLSSGYRAALIKSAVGAILAVGLTVGVCSLGNGARVAIQDQLMGGGDQLRVKPPSYTIGSIDLAGSVLPERSMDEEAVASLQAGRGTSQKSIWARACRQGSASMCRWPRRIPTTGQSCAPSSHPR